MEIKRSFYTTVSHEFEIDRVEDVVCNLCGGAEYASVGRELDFDIRACTGCGLVYVSPQPIAEELPKLYAGMYDDVSDAEAARRSAGLVERHLRRIVVRRLPEGGALLEVGCGLGGFLAAMRDTSFRLRAIEFDSEAAAYARERVPGVEVERAGIEDATIEAESLDCVVAIAVLEHVKDPRAALAALSSWLRPGGVLVVQVPRVTPFLRVKRWLPWLPVYFEAPRHLYDFSPDTLRRYFEELGYREVRVEVARPYASNGAVGLALIWGVKVLGLALYALSGGRYVYPFAGAFVIHSVKGVPGRESF